MKLSSVVPTGDKQGGEQKQERIEGSAESLQPPERDDEGDSGVDSLSNYITLTYLQKQKDSIFT